MFVVVSSALSNLSPACPGFRSDTKTINFTQNTLIVANFAVGSNKSWSVKSWCEEGHRQRPRWLYVAAMVASTIAISEVTRASSTYFGGHLRARIFWLRKKYPELYEWRHDTLLDTAAVKTTCSSFQKEVFKAGRPLVSQATARDSSATHAASDPEARI